MTSCTGPSRSVVTEEPYCPVDNRYSECQETTDWTERCELCAIGRERDEERWGDQDRDDS